MKLNTIIVFLITITLQYEGLALRRVSVASGLWTNSSIWSPSGIPGCSDTIVISASHTVTVNSQINLSGCSVPSVIYVYGTLYFQGGNKLRLACNSKFFIFADAKIDSDGNGNSNQIEICNTTFWNGSQGAYEGPSCMPAGTPGCLGVLLPVELLSFDVVHCDQTSVCVKWSTASELNNHFFEVQRSINGVDFVTLAKTETKAPNGYSKFRLDYEVKLNRPNEKQTYYRLKQVDFDGTFSYSRISFLEENKTAYGIDVYPNPSKGLIFIESNNGLLKDKVSLRIHDHLMRSVFNADLSIDEDPVMIDLRGKLQAGIYLLRVENQNGEVQQLKLVVQP